MQGASGRGWKREGIKTAETMQLYNDSRYLVPNVELDVPKRRHGLLPIMPRSG